MVETLTDEEKDLILRLFEEDERRRRWWDEHFDEFMERYPEQFVAVRNEAVIDWDEDFFALVDRVSQGAPRLPDDIDIELISTYENLIV